MTIQQEKIVGGSGASDLVTIVGKDNIALMIVLITISVLAVIGIICCVRYMFYQSNKDVIEA